MKRPIIATSAKLAVVAVLMFGFGYALVPLYEKFCIFFGIRAPLEQTTVTPGKVTSNHAVKIEFDSNVRDLPWELKPIQTSIQTTPGKIVRVEFEVINRGAAGDGRAVVSYAPAGAAPFIKKLDCFCFTDQHLGKGQTKRLPVVFYLDPETPKEIHTLTLSYTVYPSLKKDL